MHIDFDRSKSLQALEGKDWGDAPRNLQWSYLVKTVHRVRRLPLRELTIEYIAMLTRQNLSLEYMIPMAIELLQEDPWIGDSGSKVVFRNGGLLRSVLNDRFADKAMFWQQHHDMWDLMTQVLQQALVLLPTLDPIIYESVNKEWRNGPEPTPSLVEQIKLALEEG